MKFRSEYIMYDFGSFSYSRTIKYGIPYILL